MKLFTLSLIQFDKACNHDHFDSSMAMVTQKYTQEIESLFGKPAADESIVFHKENFHPPCVQTKGQRSERRTGKLNLHPGPSAIGVTGWGSIPLPVG